MIPDHEITSMGRKEMAAKYRMSTKTLNRYLKRYGLNVKIGRSSIVPALVVKDFIHYYGHWKYRVND